MAINWKYVKPLKDKNSIASFCAKNGVEIPADLMQYLAEHNSGRPSICEFDTNIGKGYIFNSLFSYNEEDVNRIFPTYEALFEDTNLYPIAIEAGGNIVCLNLDTQILVLWNHETDEIEQIDISSNPELFAGFIK